MTSPDVRAAASRSVQLALGALALASCVGGTQPTLGFRAGDTVGPGLAFSTHAFGGSEQPGKKRRPSHASDDRALATSASAAPQEPPLSGSASASAPSMRWVPELPDPPIQASREQLELTLEWANGAARLTHVTRRSNARPVVSTRVMGRFAVELWVGEELLERVRFDFPLLTSEPVNGKRRYDDPVRLDDGLVSQARVRVPVLERARRLELVDRGARTRTALPWPLRPGAVSARVPASASASVGPSRIAPSASATAVGSLPSAQPSAR